MYLFKATENSRVLQSGLNELTVSAGLGVQGAPTTCGEHRNLKLLHLAWFLILEHGVYLSCIT